MMTIPTTLRQRFSFEFIVLARRWRQALDDSLAAAGLINDAAWAPLVHLDNGGHGIRQQDLAARAGLDGSTLVRLLDLLAERGLIERQVDDSDRRAKLIFLTTAGRDTVTAMWPVLEATDLEILADVADDEIAFMRSRLHQIEQRLDTLRKRPA